MAKQTSKYFASVISSLIESRRNESIEIDQNLKQQLREGLMARAELMEKPESAGVKEYLTKWRYAFALVPSALLLTIVAAHVMNLPVEMDSDVVVPMVSTSETIESSPDGGGFISDSGVYDADAGKVSVFEDIDDVSVGDVEVDVLEFPKKIKTFPGATVMPENYLTIDTGGNKSSVIVTPAKVTSGEVGSGGSEEVIQDDVENFGGDYQPQGSFRYELIEDIFIDRDGDTSVGDDQERERDVVESHKEVKSSVDGGGGDDDYDGGGNGLNVVDGGGGGLSVEPGDDGSANVGDNGLSVGADEGDGGLNAGGDAGSSDGGLGDQGQQDDGGDSGLVPYSGSGNLNVNQTFVDVTDANVTNGSGSVNRYNISYYANLSTSERADLESRHIASLTNGKDVRSVVVSEDAGVIRVEVYFMDGTSKVKTFARQVSGSGIDEVRVVNTQTVQQTRGLQYRSFNIDYTQSCLSRGACVSR